MIKFYELLNEALNPEEWLNLTTDTTNASEIKDPGFSEVSDAIGRLLDETAEDNIIFISPEIALGKDYLAFDKSIIPKSTKVKDVVINDGNIIRYLTLYEYEGINFVSAEFRDMYEYPFIYISKEKFDEINQAVFPDEAGEIVPAAGEAMGVDDGLSDLQEPGPENEDDGLPVDDLSLQEETPEPEDAQDDFGSQDTTDEEEEEDEDNKGNSLLD